MLHVEESRRHRETGFFNRPTDSGRLAGVRVCTSETYMYISTIDRPQCLGVTGRMEIDTVSAE